MNDLNLSFNRVELDLATVTLLADILAEQRATTKVLIHLLSDDDEHAEANYQGWQKQATAERKDIMEELYARHGRIDFGDLIPPADHTNKK